MAIFNMFKQKGTLTGDAVVHGLPPHKFYSVTVTFFPVPSASSPPPFDGDPPTSKWVDTAPVKEATEPDNKPLRFRFVHAAGYYYLGVGIIAFIERGAEMLAQVERFFPMSQPCEIQAGREQQIRLAVTWPDIPLDELGVYGVFEPRKGNSKDLLNQAASLEDVNRAMAIELYEKVIRLYPGTTASKEAELNIQTLSKPSS